MTSLRCCFSLETRHLSLARGKRQVETIATVTKSYWLTEAGNKCNETILLFVMKFIDQSPPSRIEKGEHRCNSHSFIAMRIAISRLIYFTSSIFNKGYFNK